ncbi:unnamed protein product [Hymenolepis diminuta]|uniref:CA domain-containing protein n=1 Tax=Hymenolepis diminuta TaxID=6216 RepID=A0A158QBN5_HYMDI|nr:unnamed protein product [Hymenolepis diminuta]
MCDVKNACHQHEIDDSFYRYCIFLLPYCLFSSSRQRYVIGDEAMHRLSDSTVLICGLGGVGVEIAKNLALAGVKNLILDDSIICTPDDLATQFYIRSENIKRGDTRAEASLPHLSALNPYVFVTLSNYPFTGQNGDILGALKNKYLNDITCIVATDCNLFFAALLNNYCRRYNIKFVYANTIGVLGNIFCDFGENIEYGPPDEEPPMNFFIDHIENAEKPKLTVKDSEQHKLADGSYITFHEISGMTELNGMTVRVKEISPKILELDVDTRNFGVFTGSGVATEFKASTHMSHLPLAMQLENPRLCTVDLVHPASSVQLHTAFVVLMMFFSKEKRLPRACILLIAFLLAIGVKGISDSVIKLPINSHLQILMYVIDAKLLSKICATAQGQIPPLCSFFGGLAAQEVIKAVTFRFTPLNQWLYLGVDCLVPQKIPKSSLLFSASSRYRPLVACIGSKNVEKLSMASAFMVGCGAIGCELLKNLALIGFASNDFRQSGFSFNSSNSVPNGDAPSFTSLSPSEAPENSLDIADVDFSDDINDEHTSSVFFRDIHHLALELMRLGHNEDGFKPNQGDVPMDSRLEVHFTEADQLLNASQALTSTAKIVITVKDLDDNPPMMLQQTYAFEVTEGILSHTVVGKVEATGADSLPEDRVINYQLRAPQSGDGPSSSSSFSDMASAISANAALHFFIIDRHHGIIRIIRPLDREQTPKITLEVVAISGHPGRLRITGSTSPSSTATVVITVLDKNGNAPFMISLATSEKKRVLIAEVVIPSDKLQDDPPVCVPFPYAFNGDDDKMSGNGNVTVTLDTNPSFEFNEEQISLCPKTEKSVDNASWALIFAFLDLLRLPLILRSNLNIGSFDSPTSVQEEPAAFNTNSNASIRRPCITITDNDHIEKSNLNRQFLFRPEHVGMAKSQVAAESILQFNPALKVVPLTHKFCVDTSETLFTDEYIQIAASGGEKSSPPVVLAALDNIEARQYLDQRCVINRLAMFDSGTQGTKGHTQVILPGITESYNDQSDPGSSGAGEIPYCTLKSFPAKPVDCVEWAREKFFTLFTLKPQNLSTLFCNFYNSSKCLLEAFQSVLNKGLNEFQNCKINASNLSYLINRPRTIEDCVHLALEKFEKYFRDKALNLLHRFPPDFTTGRGELFWQLPRRKPTPLTFDITNSLHLEFIWSFSRLLCLQSGMPLPSRTLGDFERNLLANAVKSFTSKPFIPLDKEVVVDPTVQRPAKKSAIEECPALDNNLRGALQKAIETLREYDSRLPTLSMYKSGFAEAHTVFFTYLLLITMESII